MISSLVQPGQQRVLEDLSDDVCGNQYRQRTSSPLVHLVLCSRRFQQIVEPILYREFVEFYARSKPPRAKHQLFLCHLLARPDLAKRVRKYTGSCQSYNPNEDDRENSKPVGLDMSSLTEEDWSRVKTAIQLLEPDGERTSLWNIEDGSWDAMTTVILSLLPNLEELKFYNWPSSGDELPSLTAFLSRSAYCQREFQELHRTSISSLARLKSSSLIWGWGVGKNGMNLEALFDFMKLKSLRSISARRVESCSGTSIDEDTIWDAKKMNPDRLKDLDFSHILDISLQWSAITVDRFAYLIRLCPNLQRLEYESRRDDVHVASAGFEAPKYLLALQPVKATLQELVIVEDNNHGILRIFPFGSFASFTALQTLETSQNLLLGNFNPQNRRQNAPILTQTMTLITTLPQTIQRLILHGCTASLTPLLFEFLTHKLSFPALKYLELSWAENPNFRGNYNISLVHAAGSPSDVSELLWRCEKAGVELKMLCADTPDRILMPDGLDRQTGKPIGRHIDVKYPYEGWEEMCKEYGCDPATGSRSSGSTRRF